jgi:AraC-like DNA-binding protein
MWTTTVPGRGGITVRARWPPTDARDGPCPEVPLDIRGQSFDSYRQSGTARRTGEAVSTKPMVSALWVPVLVGTIRGAGWSEERIGRTLGLRRDQLRLERRIPLDKYFALVDLVADVIDDPCFGLHFGAAHAFETAGVFNYIVQNSPNVGAAIANGVRYLRLIVDAAELSLELTGSRACLVYRMTNPSIVPSRHFTELVIAYGLKGMRVIVRDDAWTPHEIRFRHAAPGDRSPYERLFGATVRFQQGEDALVFDRRLLSQPIHTADLQLLRILETHAQEILAELPPADDLVNRLEQFVVGALPNASAGLSAAARALGMSTRTLQRRLRARGIVYAGLIDEVRRRLSGRYLANGDLSLGEIAYLLGYSESSAFNRAYRRWTGRTPSADRRRAAA